MLSAARALTRLASQAPHPHLASLYPLRATMASSTTYTSQSLLDLIVQDHKKVDYLFNEYRKAPTTEMKQQLGYQIIRELCIHSSKEEEVVYPAISKAFGTEARDHLLKEHQGLKNGLQAMSDMSADKDEKAYDEKVFHVEALFRHHIKEEEASEIPRLIKADGVVGAKLAEEFEKAAAHAVTRPHPWAPDKAPINKVAHMATAPLDAAADALRFAGNTPSVNPPQ